jgi:hypothetical protein
MISGNSRVMSRGLQIDMSRSLTSFKNERKRKKVKNVVEVSSQRISNHLDAQHIEALFLFDAAK